MIVLKGNKCVSYEYMKELDQYYVVFSEKQADGETILVTDTRIMDKKNLDEMLWEMKHDAPKPHQTFEELFEAITYYKIDDDKWNALIQAHFPTMQGGPGSWGGYNVKVAERLGNDSSFNFSLDDKDETYKEWHSCTIKNVIARGANDKNCTVTLAYELMLRGILKPGHYIIQTYFED